MKKNEVREKAWKQFDSDHPDDHSCVECESAEGFFKTGFGAGYSARDGEVEKLKKRLAVCLEYGHLKELPVGATDWVYEQLTDIRIDVIIAQEQRIQALKEVEGNE